MVAVSTVLSLFSLVGSVGCWVAIIVEVGLVLGGWEKGWVVRGFSWLIADLGIGEL